MADKDARQSLVVCALASSPNDCWLIRCDVGRVLTIDDLPDDDLPTIFEFYVVRNYQYLDFDQLNEFGIKRSIESWQSLVHVCRRWRGVVFRSRRCLNLQLFCQPEISGTKSLDVWPALPLLIKGDFCKILADNVIALLKHSDRIRQINLDCHETWQIEPLWTAMQVPFPELTGLRLLSRDLSDGPAVPVLPDSFLGGSAPRLRCFFLRSIPFPGLPKLLLSATHLINLRLSKIPRSGYISPEAMATCLSILTSLETLHFDFESPHDQESRSPPPPTRSVLPALKWVSLKGANEYLGKLLARIDAPRLYRLETTFFDYDTDLNNTPELDQFISRTPTLGAYDEAHFIFFSDEVLVRLPEPSGHRMVEVRILGDVPDRQLSNLTKICTLSLRHLLTMENLYVVGNRYSLLIWRDDIENTKWLDLLLPFTAVKNLYLSELFLPRIASALQELTGGRTTEVLPALQNVFLEGFRPSKPVHEGIARFISARQLTNYPVAIAAWD